MQLSLALDIIRRSTNPEINRLINRIGFILAVAPARFITKAQFANVHHIEASSDPVPKLLPLSNNRSTAIAEKTVTTIPCQNQGMGSHSFQNKIYHDVLLDIIDDLNKKYTLK